jgi:hypothetical protein
MRLEPVARPTQVIPPEVDWRRWRRAEEKSAQAKLIPSKDTIIST